MLEYDHYRGKWCLSIDSAADDVTTWLNENPDWHPLQFQILQTISGTLGGGYCCVVFVQKFAPPQIIDTVGINHAILMQDPA